MGVLRCGDVHANEITGVSTSLKESIQKLNPQSQSNAAISIKMCSNNAQIRALGRSASLSVSLALSLCLRMSSSKRQLAVK